MWTFEEVQRAGTTVLIFYIDGNARGQIVCHDESEVNLWRTVLPILNSTNKSGS